MTTNGNGHYDLAGTELADDGLDLVQKLESHLSIHPEDSETRGALQQLFAAPVVKPIRLWDWTMAPEAKPMEWLVENWLPAGRVSMLTGEGGAGKSRLALQLAAGIVTGGDGDGGWIDVPIDYLRLGPSVGDGRPVIFASWEDTEDDFSRRLSEISGPASPWITPDRLKMLKVTDLSGYGPAWGQSHPANLPTLTETGQELRSAAENLGAALLILDPVAAAYAGNENDRGQVRQFITDWDAWGRATNCGVLILAHPPKSGAEYSGSTDWNGAVRSRWAMQKVRRGPAPGKGQQDNRSEEWQLSLPKRNYAAEVDPLALLIDKTAGALRWQAEPWYMEG